MASKFSFFNILLTIVLLNIVKAQMLRNEARQTVTQLITESGYPVERYRVKTEDGYILQLHRIPAGKRRARRIEGRFKGKRPILMVHGLLGSSGDFVIMGPDRSLGYLLADAGYDVWLGNLRGNFYTTHQNYTRNDPKFWEYSFHEHGKYDIPAMIDKILSVTKMKKVLYIGYSMGTTSFFTMMSERPEYNDKVIAFVALAPAVFLDNIKNLAEFGLTTMNIASTMRNQGVYSVTVDTQLLDLFIGGVCSVKQPQQDLCMRVVYSIVGEDYEQNDWEMSPVILARFQPASWRQLEHFGKIAITGVFAKWDNGLTGPVRAYNLSNVRVPVKLFYGENDKLVEKSQIMRLAAALNNTGMLEEMRPACSWPKFNHLDFVFARDVGKLLNKPLLKHVDRLFNKYGRR